MKHIRNFLLGCLFVYVALVSYLYTAQRSFMYHPSKENVDLSSFNLPAMRTVQIKTTDGLNLEGWYQPSATNEAPTILMFHGNAGHLGNRAGKAKRFLNQGYGVLLAEYRGYGNNSGKPTEQGLYNDARAYTDWLINKANTPENMIVLYGESLGTGIAVQMAVEYPDAKALILEAPYTSFADVAQVRYPFVPVRPLIKDRYDSLSKISGLSMPLLVVHGEKDQVIDIHFAKTLFAEAHEPKLMHVIAHGGHSNLYEYGAAEKVLAFLKGAQDNGANEHF